MTCLQRRPKTFFLVFTIGMGVLIGSEGRLGAERVDPTEPYKGVREATLRYIALGAPDDSLRLRDAFDKNEQEIARLKLGAVQPEKQPQLSAMRDRLAESEALLQLLETSGKELPNRELDRLSATERASLRTKLSGRIEALRETIGVLEKEIRFEQGESLRILVEERRALARLLAVRREQLLGEYEMLSGCTVADRPCLHRKLKTLCKLKRLFSATERVPILHLIQEVDSQLNVSGQPVSTMCEYLQYDFGLY